MRWLVAALLSLALPASAGASSVSWYESVECASTYDCKYQRTPNASTVAYYAEPGERNALRISLLPDGHVRVTDPGAVVRADGRCTSVSAHEATCPPATGASVSLFDGDDSGQLDLGATRESYLHGGDGDDVLTGSAAPERLDGGFGRDRIAAGGGDDVIAASEHGGAPDEIDGGPGVDTVDFAYRSEPVSVAVTDLPGIESVRGGSGNDTLVGTDGSDVLDGGWGDDDLRGGDGDDRLIGDEGQDRLSGGAGDDVIEAVDRNADAARCGAGRDRVGQRVLRDTLYGTFGFQGVDLADSVAADCESLGFDSEEEGDATFLDPRVVRSRGTISLRNPCAGRGDAGCRGLVQASSGARRTARRYRAGTRWVRLRAPRGSRALRMYVVLATSDGAWRETTWTAGR